MKLIVTDITGITEYEPENESITSDEISNFLYEKKPFSFYDIYKQRLTLINPNMCGTITIEED